MKCAVISGGRIENYELIGRIAKQCDLLLCADFGIEHARKMGLVADVLVGDFDSMTGKYDNYKEIIALPKEKDDTDTFYAARLALERGADSVVLLGCSGTRLDHTYANLFALAYLAENGVEASLVDEFNEIRLLFPGSYEFSGDDGTYLSLLPFCSAAEGVTLTGVKYPISNARLGALHPLGVSNEITDESAHLSFTNGMVAVFKSHD